MINSLNFFRIFGTILIFICHLRLPNNIGGSIGLDIFWVLSGFAIYLGYSDKLSGSNLVSFKSFITKRILKIYPVYFVMTLVGFVYMTLICKYSFATTMIKLPGHLLFLQPYVSGFFSAFNGAAWYVAALMWVYVFFYLIRFGKKQYIFMLLWVCVLLLIETFFISVINTTKFDFYHSPTTVVAFFYIGVLAADIFKHHKLHLSQTSFTIIETILILGLFSSLLFFRGVLTLLPNLIFCIFSAFLYYVFAHQKGSISQWFENKMFKTLSSYSFYFYMAHYMVIQYVVHIFDLPYTSWFVSIVLFITTCLFSILLKKFDVFIQNKIKNQ